MNLKLGTENGATAKYDAIPCRDTFGTSDRRHLSRLANRLTKILCEVQALETPDK